MITSLGRQVKSIDAIVRYRATSIVYGLIGAINIGPMIFTNFVLVVGNVSGWPSLLRTYMHM